MGNPLENDTVFFAQYTGNLFRLWYDTAHDVGIKFSKRKYTTKVA